MLQGWKLVSVTYLYNSTEPSALALAYTCVYFMLCIILWELSNISEHGCSYNAMFEPLKCSLLLGLTQYESYIPL